MARDTEDEQVRQILLHDVSTIKTEDIRTDASPERATKERHLERDLPEIITVSGEGIHKRRASTSPLRVVVTETTTPATDSSSAQDGIKHARLHQGEANKVSSCNSVSAPRSTHGYGDLTLDRAPGSIGQSFTSDRSFSGSSTSSRSSKIVLLNRPSSAPVSPGIRASTFSVWQMTVMMRIHCMILTCWRSRWRASVRSR